MPAVTRLTVGVTTSVALIIWSQADARGDDSFRCGTHLIELGESSEAIKEACGRPATIHKINGDVQNGDGTTMAIEYEAWTYDLGPTMFSRILVFSGGGLASIRTGNYGGW